MLQFGHFCHPGFSGDHSPFVQARRWLIQQSQINFPSPPSLFLLSCGWRVSPHICWDHVFYIWVFPRLPCRFSINGLAHQGLAKISQTNVALFVSQQTELAQSNALPTISVRLYGAWSIENIFLFSFRFGKCISLSPDTQNFVLWFLSKGRSLWVLVLDFTVCHYSRLKLTYWTSEGCIQGKVTSIKGSLL